MDRNKGGKKGKASPGRFHQLAAQQRQQLAQNIPVGMNPQQPTTNHDIDPVIIKELIFPETTEQDIDAIKNCKTEIVSIRRKSGKSKECEMCLGKNATMLEHCNARHLPWFVFAGSACRMCYAQLNTNTDLRSHELMKHNGENVRLPPPVWSACMIEYFKLVAAALDINVSFIPQFVRDHKLNITECTNLSEDSKLYYEEPTFCGPFPFNPVTPFTLRDCSHWKIVLRLEAITNGAVGRKMIRSLNPQAGFQFTAPPPDRKGISQAPMIKQLESVRQVLVKKKQNKTIPSLLDIVIEAPSQVPRPTTSQTSMPSSSSGLRNVGSQVARQATSSGPRSDASQVPGQARHGSNEFHPVRHDQREPVREHATSQHDNKIMQIQLKNAVETGVIDLGGLPSDIRKLVEDIITGRSQLDPEVVLQLALKTSSAEKRHHSEYDDSFGPSTSQRDAYEQDTYRPKRTRWDTSITRGNASDHHHPSADTYQEEPSSRRGQAEYVDDAAAMPRSREFGQRQTQMYPEESSQDSYDGSRYRRHNSEEILHDKTAHAARSHGDYHYRQDATRSKESTPASGNDESKSFEEALALSDKLSHVPPDLKLRYANLLTRQLKLNLKEAESMKRDRSSQGDATGSGREMPESHARPILHSGKQKYSDPESRYLMSEGLSQSSRSHGNVATVLPHSVQRPASQDHEDPIKPSPGQVPAKSRQTVRKVPLSAPLHSVPALPPPVPPPLSNKNLANQHTVSGVPKPVPPPNNPTRASQQPGHTHSVMPAGLAQAPNLASHVQGLVSRYAAPHLGQGTSAAEVPQAMPPGEAPGISTYQGSGRPALAPPAVDQALPDTSGTKDLDATLKSLSQGMLLLTNAVLELKNKRK